jgi:cytidine deaminase
MAQSDAGQALKDRKRCADPMFRVAPAMRGAPTLARRRCNVENASYDLCMCAERVGAVKPSAKATPPLHGRRQLHRRRPLLGAPGRMPCGACRQVLAELANPDLPIIIDGVASSPSPSSCRRRSDSAEGRGVRGGGSGAADRARGTAKGIGRGGVRARVTAEEFAEERRLASGAPAKSSAPRVASTRRASRADLLQSWAVAAAAPRAQEEVRSLQGVAPGPGGGVRTWVTAGGDSDCRSSPGAWTRAVRPALASSAGAPALARHADFERYAAPPGRPHRSSD